MEQKEKGDCKIEAKSKNSAKTFIKDLLSTLRVEVEREDVKILSSKHRNPTQASEKVSNPKFSDELRYLNNHWGNWHEETLFTSHRFLFGSMIAKFKRRLQSYLFSVIFRDYIEKQKSFNMNLVKFCNQVTRYVDERDKQIFWETVNKLDSEVALIEERYDTLFAEIIDRVNAKL